jgi:hypothetical protein
MPEAIKLLVIGLPQAGKTTFLAAFWHLLLSNEVADSLHLAELQPTRDHLNSIARVWRQWKPLPRTTLPKERVITLNVQIPGSPVIYEMTVPDASGEAFKRIFETRRCSAEFESLASEASGVMLFVHPRQAIPPQRIDVDVDKLSDIIDESLGPSGPINEDSSDASSIESLKWHPKYAAYQSKLVDLLQVARRIRGERATRLSVVISAWDLCELEHLTPPAWVEQRLPLLFQYLEANADLCPYEVYGVSAQGAELNDPGTLVESIRSSERIKVVFGGVVSHDLTLPVRGLLSPDGRAVE